MSPFAMALMSDPSMRSMMNNASTHWSNAMFGSPEENYLRAMMGRQNNQQNAGPQQSMWQNRQTQERY